MVVDAAPKGVGETILPQRDFLAAILLCFHTLLGQQPHSGGPPQRIPYGLTVTVNGHSMGDVYFSVAETVLTQIEKEEGDIEMARTQVNALIDGLIAAYKESAETLSQLSDTQLDIEVPGYGGQSRPLRGSLYLNVFQPKEHTIHVNKILQVTHAPAAHPTEAQAILAEAGQALGQFIGLLARLSDEDLDRSFEDQTPRKVAEHLRSMVVIARTRALPVLEGKATGP